MYTPLLVNVVTLPSGLLLIFRAGPRRHRCVPGRDGRRSRLGAGVGVVVVALNKAAG
ncbi:hypothetical protein [Streptomyces sp. NPDC057939]|uniref:hypothetical protein n=1 Tax=Streptomyces sp. NPDC057939 TaxID=3346284 RepID=UPI0036E540BA